MVYTSDGISASNTPLDRIEKLGDISSEKKTSIAAKKKELEEFEKRKQQEMDELESQKRREIEELEKKKKQGLTDLEKKKKELADLEKKKTQEIEDTEELIENSFQDLMRHKRLLIKEEEELEDKKKKHAQGFKLEYVANTTPKHQGPQPGGADYGKFFEQMHAPRNVYEATNYNFYSGLSHLRDRAARGEITPEEEAFVSKIREQFEGFKGNEYAREKDEHMYIERSMNVINQIWQYKTGQRGGGSHDIQY